MLSKAQTFVFVMGEESGDGGDEQVGWFEKLKQSGKRHRSPRPTFSERLVVGCLALLSCVRASRNPSRFWRLGAMEKFCWEGARERKEGSRCQQLCPPPLIDRALASK